MNLRDRSGGTPLLRAAGAGRLGALQRLLEAQADVSCKDKVPLGLVGGGWRWVGGEVEGGGWEKQR